MGVTHLTSAFGGDTLTVDEMVKDPTYIPERILENLDGAFLEEALFRNGGTNDGVVAYREAAAPYLNDNSEEVAEFAEIPVSLCRPACPGRCAASIRSIWSPCRPPRCRTP